MAGTVQVLLDSDWDGAQTKRKGEENLRGGLHSEVGWMRAVIPGGVALWLGPGSYLSRW